MIVVLGVSLAAAALTITGIRARAREERVLRVQPGMHRSEVERLLGPGSPDVSNDVSELNPVVKDQFSYEGNPSLWYRRFEDSLVVRYTNDVATSTKRIGL